MLSIATLNIHNFCDSEQLDSTYKLIHFFFYCQFDIIALQEVDDINKLKPIVGDYYYVYNRHNVILSKYPMEDLRPPINLYITFSTLPLNLTKPSTPSGTYFVLLF